MVTLNSLVDINEVRYLYKKPITKRIKVYVYQLTLTPHFYSYGDKISSAAFKMSSASFDLLKKCSRIFPHSAEIESEKIHYAQFYSNQQKINLYKSITVEIDLINLLKGFEGVVKIYIHQKKEKELEFDEVSGVHGFIWIAPWSTDAIHKVQYMELDATFELSKPYTLCCPQAVVNGLSLPLGFIVGPKENWILYKVFYDELAKLIGSMDQITGLPVLSDQGPDLVKFCGEYKIIQFL